MKALDLAKGIKEARLEIEWPLEQEHRKLMLACDAFKKLHLEQLRVCEAIPFEQKREREQEWAKLADIELEWTRATDDLRVAAACLKTYRQTLSTVRRHVYLGKANERT